MGFDVAISGQGGGHGTCKSLECFELWVTRFLQICSIVFCPGFNSHTQILPTFIQFAVVRINFSTTKGLLEVPVPGKKCGMDVKTLILWQ